MTIEEHTAPQAQSVHTVERPSRPAILKDAQRNLQKARGLLLIADNLHAQDDGMLINDVDVDTDVLAGLIEDIEDRINVALGARPGNGL